MGDAILKALEALKESVDEVGDQMEAGRDADAELAFWNSIRDAEEPSYFEAYLDQFPDGRFAAIARLKIAELTFFWTADW